VFAFISSTVYARFAVLPHDQNANNGKEEEDIAWDVLSFHPDIFQDMQLETIPTSH